VFRTSDFTQVATIQVGKLPHGIWPSGDGTRVYVGLENADRMTVINALTNTVIATVPIGQGAQAVVYVPDAVPSGDGTQGLLPLGLAGEAAHLTLVSASRGAAGAGRPPTSVSLFDQGLVQILEAAVTGLEPSKPYVLALSRRPDGRGVLEPLSAFMTNPAGAAIVNAVGPLRQSVRAEDRRQRRYLVIVSGTAAQLGPLVQIQAP
ncbi:MAG: hypothetical protein WAK19_11350, partial [Candidatus Cybelea sp.]